MNLFLECKPDKVLAMTLGVARRSIVHSDDKGGVCRRLIRTRQMSGMIDEDPMSPQPSYIRELLEKSRDYGIVHLMDSPRLHTIAVLCPRLEDWFLNVCRGSRIDLKRYNLPDRAGDLHKVINFRLKNFQSAVEELIRLKSQPLFHLRSLLIPEPPV